MVTCEWCGQTIERSELSHKFKTNYEIIFITAWIGIVGFFLVNESIAGRSITMDYFIKISIASVFWVVILIFIASFVIKSLKD